LQRIDLADADAELERVLCREVARLGDLDGDHDSDVNEFVLFLMCRKLLQQPMSMLSFCHTFGECKVDRSVSPASRHNLQRIPLTTSLSMTAAFALQLLPQLGCLFLSQPFS